MFPIALGFPLQRKSDTSRLTPHLPSCRPSTDPIGDVHRVSFPIALAMELWTPPTVTSSKKDIFCRFRAAGSLANPLLLTLRHPKNGLQSPSLPRFVFRSKREQPAF